MILFNRLRAFRQAKVLGKWFVELFGCLVTWLFDYAVICLLVVRVYIYSFALGRFFD